MTSRSRLPPFLAVLLVGGVAALAVAPRGTAQAPPANVAGNWRMSCEGRRGERAFDLVLQQTGAQLAGSVSAGGRSGDLSGEVHGDQVSFGKGRFGFSGQVEGARMTGQSKRGRPCSATRQ